MLGFLEIQKVKFPFNNHNEPSYQNSKIGRRNIL